jgi:hypothetical protein
MSTLNTSIASCMASAVACEQCLADGMEAQLEDCTEMCRDYAKVSALSARM